MDAHDWHRQATHRPIPWPDPVTFQEYEAMSRAARDEYFAALSDVMDGSILVSRPMDAVRAHLDHVMQTNLRRPPGAMQMVALTAPFSAGKSTLIKQWGFEVYRSALGDQIRLDRPTWSPDPGITADWRPVVYVTLMASSSIKEVNAQILLYLGYPPEGLARTTTTRLLQALRMHGVRVIILDDVHMLRTTNVQGRAVLDYIKFLNTELGERSQGTVVLVGADLHLTALLDDPQIRARLTTMTVGPFTIDTVDQRAAWQHLLKTAEQRPLPYLPEARPGLFFSTHAQHMWRRSQGFVGDVAKLVSGTVLRAFQGRTNEITRDDLDAVTLSDQSLDRQLDQIKLEQKPRRRGQ